MRTDDICATYADQKVGLTVRSIDADLILIQGSTIALRMLAELLVAVVEESENDGFSISPTGAGSVLFSKEATLGIYIHRKE